MNWREEQAKEIEENLKKAVSELVFEKNEPCLYEKLRPIVEAALAPLIGMQPWELRTNGE